MANFSQMQTDLSLLGMANLANTDIGTLINKANRDEVESWDWSFLYTNIVISSIAPYSVGLLTMTAGSDQAQGDGTQLFTSQQAGYFLSVGGTLTTPIIVDAVLDANTLHLSTPWGGITQTGSYSLFPLYYDVFPLIEVHRVRQISFLTETSQEALNRIDPSRVSTGGDPAIRWAPAPWNNSGHFQIELWPRPTSLLPYLADGKMGAQDLLNPADLPQVPSLVLEAKVAMLLSLSVFASTGNPKWLQLSEFWRGEYVREREDARVADNRRKVTLGMSASGARGGVNLGHDFTAVHDIAGPPYAGVT